MKISRRFFGYGLVICCLSFFLTACETQVVPSSANTAPFAGLSQSEKDQLAAQYNVQLGLGYLKQGNKNLAKQKLALALQQNPNDPTVLDGMAYYWENVGEDQTAENYYKKAVDINPHSGIALNNYGTFLCRQGHYQTSEAYFLKAVQDLNYTDMAGAYENAGLCALQIPDVVRAKADFEKAVQYDENRPLSWYELARLNNTEGNEKAAANAVDEYLKWAPPSKDVLELGIEIAKKQGNAAKVASYTTLLRDKFPTE